MAQDGHGVEGTAYYWFRCQRGSREGNERTPALFNFGNTSSAQFISDYPTGNGDPRVGVLHLVRMAHTCEVILFKKQLYGIRFFNRIFFFFSG